MRAIREPDTGGCPRDLLHRHDMVEIAEPRAAVLFGDGDAVQAELAHLRPEIAGKLVVAVDCLRTRGDLFLREGRDRLADGVGGIAEIEIEGGRSIGNHGTGLLHIWLLPLYS